MKGGSLGFMDRRSLAWQADRAFWRSSSITRKDRKATAEVLIICFEQEEAITDKAYGYAGKSI